ncbi:PPOX class F420-dependent oxidoreductase [Euzebya pacifica]|uniref:PPOX class F420-dependent oxidoreductase n=1 Tax=Euzebya pacifica TaxID=1608957 RepID=UPI0030F55952
MEIAQENRVDREALLDFVRPRRNLVLVTSRADGRPQASPVTGAVGSDGRLLISSYPTRAKVANLRRTPGCAVMVQSDDFNGPWVQVYGDAEVLDGEDGVEALVDYFRSAAGEHPDWEEYRQAMRDRAKVAIAITIDDWGPIATGGLPPEFAPDEEG